MWGAAGALLRVVIWPIGIIVVRTLFGLTIRGARFLPRRGAALVVCNHQGYLDPVFVQIGTTRTVHYMMTSRFYDIPRVRPLFKVIGAIRVHEGGMNRDSMRAALDTLGAGGIIGLFPEGRLSVTGEIGRMNPGAAFLATRSGVPVVPARIRGSIDILPKGRWLPRTGRVTLRYGPPLTLTGLGRKAATAKLREAIEAL